MNEEELIRNLKIELKKFEDKKYFTGETRIDLMIKDVLSVLEKQQAEIKTLKRDFEIVDHECSRLEQEDIKKDKILNLMAKDIKEADKFLDSMGHLGEYAGYTIEDIIEEYKKEAEYKIKEDK